MITPSQNGHTFLSHGHRLVEDGSIHEYSARVDLATREGRWECLDIVEVRDLVPGDHFLWEPLHREEQVLTHRWVPTSGLAFSARTSFFDGVLIASNKAFPCYAEKKVYVRTGTHFEDHEDLLYSDVPYCTDPECCDPAERAAFMADRGDLDERTLSWAGWCILCLRPNIHSIHCERFNA